MAEEIGDPIYPDLKGKVAVVTGGSKGIGAKTCQLLAKQGTKVAVGGRDARAIDAVVEQIRVDGGTAIGVVAECREFVAIERMRERVEDALGPADIVVAFAGGFRAYTAVHMISEEEWRAVIDSNLTATFLTLKSFLPGMLQRKRGSIVTMASNAARVLDILTSASYSSAKAGIVMLTRHVAKEVGPYGVRVNCVAPATVLTDRVNGIMSKQRQREVAALAPLGRLGKPEDVAWATLFLVSETSSWLTGVTLDISGGRIML